MLARFDNSVGSFNPRTREGCDIAPRITGVRRYCFNPRTREGCDHSATIRVMFLGGFNPRTREGCDVGVVRLRPATTAVSIHAPVRGATLTREGWKLQTEVSIHAPVRGATS